MDERKPEQQNRPRRKRQEVRRQTEDAAALLCRAWDEAKRGRSWEWVLAEKFHWGITARLRFQVKWRPIYGSSKIGRRTRGDKK